jgi:hypothetical protein
MVCDEMWSYDEEKGTATLSGLRALCPPCNQARHLGWSRRTGRAEEARKQLARVNGWTDEELAAADQAASHTWRRRSEQSWTTDVAPVLLAAYPVLSVAVGLSGIPGDGEDRVAEAEFGGG